MSKEELFEIYKLVLSGMVLAQDSCVTDSCLHYLDEARERLEKYIWDHE